MSRNTLSPTLTAVPKWDRSLLWATHKYPSQCSIHYVKHLSHVFPQIAPDPIKMSPHLN